MISALYGTSRRVAPAPVPDESWKQRCLKAEKEAAETRTANKALLAKIKSMDVLVHGLTSATRVVYATNGNTTQKLKQEVTRLVSDLETAKKTIDRLKRELDECKLKVHSFDRRWKAREQEHKTNIYRLERVMLFNHYFHEKEVGVFTKKVEERDARIIELEDLRPICDDQKKLSIKTVKKETLEEVLNFNELFDPISADAMVKPRLLRCMHAFSKDYLDTWWSKDGGAHRNECPTCRRKIGVYMDFF